MNKPSFYHLFCVRDGEKDLGRVLQSLLGQSIQPDKINIVDDGSTDKTSQILEEFRKQNPNLFNIIRIESRTRDFTRIPHLWNMCLENGYDYHWIGAADTVYNKDYAEIILKRMEENPNLVITSGHHPNPKEKPVSPHGGGRFVRQSFFFKYYDQYPAIMGYESQIIHKARLEGYEADVTYDAIVEHTQPLGKFHNFAEFGQGMKSLGYHPVYALMMITNNFFKNPVVGKKGSLQMFWYYMTFFPKNTGYYSKFNEDFRNQLRQLQKQRIKRLIRRPYRLIKLIR